MTTITVDAIRQVLSSNKSVIDLNIEGLNHADSLLQPEVKANCLNWVLGHIVATRCRALSLLGEAPVWPDATIARYATGSDSILNPEDAVPWEDIVAALNRSQEKLFRGLDKVSFEDLQRELESGVSLGQQLLGLAWHETYHAGQTDFLRRLAGREDGGVA